MIRDAFDTWRRRRIAAGQRQLADTMRTLIFRADESLFDRLDFQDDSQFLHPSAFACFTQPSPRVGLAQALYGAIPRDHRPGRIRIDTDEAGCAHLGSVGVIATSRPGKGLQFGRDVATGCYVCTDRAEPVPFGVRPYVDVPAARIEVTTEADPLFDHLMGLPGGQTAAPRACVGALLLALALMRAHCPGVWTEVVGVVRRIVLFQAAGQNSFAALSAHGAIFCNVAHNAGEIALLEDVAHQAAHVLFNAMAHQAHTVLAIDPQTPIGAGAWDGIELRPLYEVLHGLFTYTVIVRVLGGVLDAGALSELQAHEAMGRLGFTLQRFASDLDLLRLPGAYTLAGQRCYDAFARQHVEMQARYGTRAAFDNQPYVFDYRRFVERNGGPFPLLSALAS